MDASHTLGIEFICLIGFEELMQKNLIFNKPVFHLDTRKNLSLNYWFSNQLLTMNRIYDERLSKRAVTIIYISESYQKVKHFFQNDRIIPKDFLRNLRKTERL